MIKLIMKHPVILEEFIKYLKQLNESLTSFTKTYTTNAQCLIILQFIHIKYRLDIEISKNSVYITDKAMTIDPYITHGSIVNLEPLTIYLIEYCANTPI